jgi:signal transduction histidine kinase
MVYNKLNQPERALHYLLSNVSLTRKYGYKDELERSYKLAAESFLLKNDVRQAYVFQSKYILLHDSIYNKKNSERVSLMQIQFDTEMKQAEIDLLTKDSLLKRDEINTQRIWMFFTTGGLTLLMLLAFVLYYNNRRFKKVNALLEEQYSEIQRQAQQLSNINNTKDKLFSIISHDLRSPVASLKGLMEVIGSDNLSQKQFIALTHQVRQNLDYLYEDLDNLLQWAQSQLRGLQAVPEEVDLQQSVDEKITLFASATRHKNISIVNGIPPGTKAYADRNHIGLVFRNLIGNAVKFNPQNGEIRIACNASDDLFEVSVSDAGVGISMDDLNKLFNAETHFTTPGTNHEKGVGIGLLLTKEFVEINGGSIWVTSELGKGSKFTFTVKPADASKLK